MCGVDFTKSMGYTKSNIWYIPDQPKVVNDKNFWIISTAISIYNAKILQPLCNIRNTAMANCGSSPWEKRTISYLCAAAMVISGLIFASLEAITRLAVGIITIPLLLGLLCKKRKPLDWTCLSAMTICTAIITVLTIGAGMRAAKECFTKNAADIESMRDSFVIGEVPVS